MGTPSSTAVEVATAMSEITLTNTLTSPFLRLPAELRNKIYTYLGHSTQIHVAATITKANLIDQTRDSSIFTMQFHLPGLLSTCQQTRSEATALVYDQTTVDTVRGDAWYWLYSKSSHQLCAHMTSLRISEVFLDLMTREVEAREANSQATKACTLHLPHLERVCVFFTHFPSCQQGGESTKEAIRKWFGDDGLDVVIEERPGEKYPLSQELYPVRGRLPEICAPRLERVYVAGWLREWEDVRKALKVWFGVEEVCFERLGETEDEYNEAVESLFSLRRISVEP